MEMNHAGGCKLTKACKALSKRSNQRPRYEGPGQVYRQISYSANKQWMKHGTWKRERCVLPPCEGPKVAPMGDHGLVIVKKAK